MSAKSSICRLAMMMAMMGSASIFGGDSMKSFHEANALSDAEKAELERIKKQNSIDRLLKRGCSEFLIEGEIIVALNFRTAQKKFEKIQKLIKEIKNESVC